MSTFDSIRNATNLIENFYGDITLHNNAQAVLEGFKKKTDGIKQSFRHRSYRYAELVIPILRPHHWIVQELESPISNLVFGIGL